MNELPDLPLGFLANGSNSGIKNAKRDLGVIVSENEAVFWGSLTTNRSRAHCIERAEAIRSGGRPVRALIVCSGNANALTGPKGKEDDAAMARALAEKIGVEPHEVLTASTGVIGHRLPVDKVVSGVPKLVAQMSEDPETFAQSIMTTDRTMKVAVREIFIEGIRVKLHAVAKGAGMIAPELATTLCFVTTDCAMSQAALRMALESAVETSFNQISVDGDMSTNDCIYAMANGAAENESLDPGDTELQVFTEALTDLLQEIAKAIVRDGEGATRMFEMRVEEAASYNDARALSLSVVSSSLVKAAIFGADPYAWGRIGASLGAAAAYVNAAFDPDRLELELQGTTVFKAGEPVELGDAAAVLKHRMTEPEIYITAKLGQGTGQAKAWGCDLTYDYVKINADYATVTRTDDQGQVSVDERLSEFGPTIKKKLLIEALRYIDRFNHVRAVIKLGGAAMVDPKLEMEFAEDVLLLQSVGLRPIVVHGGGPEISRTLDKLGVKSEFIDGLRVTDRTSMEVVEMVLSGSVNQRIVAALNRQGGKGVGLSGKDGALIRAKPIQSSHDYGQVGEVVSVDCTLIDMLEKDGRVPVISPVGLGDDGSAFNINADVVASALAVALGAPKLIFLSDVAGLLDQGKVVSELNGDQLKARIERGDITGGMLPKVQAALSALRGGVENVHLVDGRVPHNVIAELFTDRGVGTLIRRT